MKKEDGRWPVKKRVGFKKLYCAVSICFLVALAAPAQSGMYREWLIVSGDREWRAVSSGIPVSGIVTTPQQGSVWGVLIPGSPALWMYADSFDTGPITSPERSTTRTFSRYIGSDFPVNHLVSATLRITADNGFILFVCGSNVGQTFFPGNVYGNEPIYSTEWRNVSTFNVTYALKRAPGEIRVDVGDYGAKAGLLLELYLVFDSEAWVAEGIPVR